MRITKVYTRTGDKGQTRLAGGREIPKDDLRIEAYGTVDELNATVGLVRTAISQAHPDLAALTVLDGMLHQIQNRLFDVGGELATMPDDLHPEQSLVTPADTADLEKWTDKLNDELGPVTEFTLPGGGPVGAHLHLARTVCRRAERRIVSLSSSGDAGLRPASAVIEWINRLSDFLFVAGRWAAKSCDAPEHLWERR